MSRSLRVAVALIATYGTGVVASLFLNHSTLGWYASLAKPAHTPPESIFYAAWLVIFSLMSVSIIMIWINKPYSPDTDAWTRFYFVSLLFNVGWPMFFFGFQAPFLALIIVGILMFTIVCLMIAAWEIDKRVTALMTPYLVWVVYAGFLNALIWYLN